MMTVNRRQAIARVLLVIFYGAAGCFHLVMPGAFVHVTPDWVPYPAQVVMITGACELAGVIGLSLLQTRRFAAIMLALYAVCVFPANIEHAVQDLSPPQHGLGWMYHAPRLFAQPFIVWWALYAGGIVGGLRRSGGSRDPD